MRYRRRPVPAARLSDMTRREAENLLIISEGRLCVRYFRRADGTVLTKDCPVGWQAVKRRVSKIATAAFSMIAGLFSGLVAFNSLGGPYQRESIDRYPMVPDVATVDADVTILTTETSFTDVEVQGQLVLGRPDFDDTRTIINREPSRKF